MGSESPTEKGAQPAAAGEDGGPDAVPLAFVKLTPAECELGVSFLLDHLGRLSPRNLKRWLRDLCNTKNISLTQLKDLLHYMDWDGDGTLTIDDVHKFVGSGLVGSHTPGELLWRQRHLKQAEAGEADKDEGANIELLAAQSLDDLFYRIDAFIKGVGENPVGNGQRRRGSVLAAAPDLGMPTYSRHTSHSSGKSRRGSVMQYQSPLRSERQPAIRKDSVRSDASSGHGPLAGPQLSLPPEAFEEPPKPPPQPPLSAHAREVINRKLHNYEQKRYKEVNDLEDKFMHELFTVLSSPAPATPAPATDGIQSAAEDSRPPANDIDFRTYFSHLTKFANGSLDHPHTLSMATAISVITFANRLVLQSRGTSLKPPMHLSSSSSAISASRRRSSEGRKGSASLHGMSYDAFRAIVDGRQHLLTVERREEKRAEEGEGDGDGEREGEGEGEERASRTSSAGSSRQ
ncbi:unnamed protein product [Vitrella brassicaformis CCMP3155]|uniref:EF-hand domain-containing protein n=1 Tax=Vitrella brassicaformis (strain CCMP3155) TaxID=1169540 RepID=A0A0G4EP41_VITBC|nr:unnamed protein product [Vitrella brassicaformis CCMP3155]|eukprot:CEL99194.1 unnamed protein product [Vitrella brassicaformis CCMP3155]